MPKTVLIADDSPIMRKLLCKMFEAEEDYDLCAEAANGEEAIALATKQRPELIILDLAMPGINGIDAARQLKRIMPQVPIILLTMYADTMSNQLPHIDLVVAKSDAANLIEHVRSLMSVD
jgi:DNA-binding NarL/FixJ family response regulator